ncbi:MAG TPA: hypothetical protein VFD84_12545 [Candidatus Binatia bacterium]|jgi:hypothetical protein|nr:hypothetical protein [Candidatus Binatia bacterium]
MADLDETELRMDAAQLWREDIFTDRRVGTIRQLTPVTSAGAPDPSRAVAFVGQTQILTAGGMLPLNFDIPAATLAEAIEKFAGAAKVALEETVRELQELRRQAASSIVIPEPGATSSILGPGGMPPRGGKPTLR